jgi:hypothetical protein
LGEKDVALAYPRFGQHLWPGAIFDHVVTKLKRLVEFLIAHQTGRKLQLHGACGLGVSGVSANLFAEGFGFLVELHPAKGGNFEERGLRPPVARNVAKLGVVFHHRADVGQTLARFALAEELGGGLQLRRLGEIDPGNRRSLITNFAIARADLDLAHHHVAVAPDSFSFDRLTAFEEDILAKGLPNEYKKHEGNNRES